MKTGNTANLPLYLLLMDACVVIDFLNAGENLFLLFERHVGKLFVVSEVAKELKPMRGFKGLEALGIEIVQSENEEFETARILRGRTSFQDNLCLLAAERLGYTCVSNDKQLRKLCQQRQVPVIWGLDMLLKLYTSGGITIEEAEHFAEQIHDSNKFITVNVLNAFKTKLNTIK